MFHKEILSSKQTELLPLVSEFKREYYLVGGTYFEDVDYTEEVDYLITTPPTEEEIKAFLIEVSTEIK